MACKWIVNDGKIYQSANVELHSDLNKQNRLDEKKTIGGGYFHWDRASNIFYFFGTSHDYGQVSKERFDAAFKNSVGKTFRVPKDAKVAFSTQKEIIDCDKSIKLNKKNNMIARIKNGI